MDYVIPVMQLLLSVVLLLLWKLMPVTQWCAFLSAGYVPGF